jgi:hypothetical protein
MGCLYKKLCHKKRNGIVKKKKKNIKEKRIIKNEKVWIINFSKINQIIRIWGSLNKLKKIEKYID